MTAGYHAPFPPAPTGVADYAAALADALRSHLDLAVNPSRECDVELYHLGNNQLHRTIYERALRRPGVAALHDAVLHHFYLGAFSEERYIDEFVFNYGAWSRGLAGKLWRGRARSAQDPRYFRYPMLRRIAESSAAVVVHNPAAAGMVRRHAPDAAVFEIPHLALPSSPPDAAAVTRLRMRLGAPPSAALFAVFGYLRESKRLSAILRAFRQVRRAAPETVLLVAGRFASTDLERSLAGRLDVEGVRRAGYLDAPDFLLHAAAADVCLNLRHPAAGETSGIAVRLMGMGKAVVMTAGDETARFPEGSCVRIDPGPAETEMLAETMLWLARDARSRRAMGRRASAHIAEVHNPAACAARFVEVLQFARRRPAIG